MNRPTRRKPLGGQQAQHLRQLRETSHRHVQEQHLQRDSASVRGRSAAQSPDPLSAARSASRTVEAVIEARLQADGGSTSARLRDQVAAARRGIQTERGERPSDIVDGSSSPFQTVPGLREGKIETLRPVERVKTTREIAAVRRRGDETLCKSSAVNRAETLERGDKNLEPRRRMGKREAEWIEKQLQLNARVATLEKECESGWQFFFAGAGAASSPSCPLSAADVNKQLEAMASSRAQDERKMRHQLRVLSSKANDVEQKVEAMADGVQYLSELQECIDAMETALAKFRLSQREQFEEFIVEEKVLEKELVVFLDKANGWESDRSQIGRGDGRNLTMGSKLSTIPRVTSMQRLSSRGRSRNNNEAGDDMDKTDPLEDQSDDTTDEGDMVQRVRRLNDAILQSGGLKGGWDDREHAVFAKLLVKSGLSDDVLLRYVSSSNQEEERPDRTGSGKERGDGDSLHYDTLVARFLRKCMRTIVTQTESSVRTHFGWYLRHLELMEEKKRVIQEWKLRKELERQQIIQCGLSSDLIKSDGTNGESNNEAARAPQQGSSTNVPVQQQHNKLDIKVRAKKTRLLQQWRLEKERKEQERAERDREQQKQDNAMEAKDLVARSRIAIEHAKAKRLRLQQLEERKQQQLQLPPRPESAGRKGTEEEAGDSKRDLLLFNATAASKARDLSKHELRKKARERHRQNAHDSYFPGEQAIPNVRIKSFGHVAIQPRAVPTWRRNL
ncbi:hypothetical protein BBJ28_00009677 [Nothophytophthora sp. Chile5]|nr:hypothetical protein BBJ28_00009677 [Nothophytophthora sp. Chile5]